MNAHSESGKLLLGFAGQKGCGKDTGANHLAAKYGYTVIGFADKIREEVVEAYRLKDILLLSDGRKEMLTSALAYQFCHDVGFVKHMRSIGRYDPLAPMSPREVQQCWGDYKRASDENYFIDEVKRRIVSTPGPVIVSGVRVSYTHSDPMAERRLIDSLGGRVVHIISDTDVDTPTHGTEMKLPVFQNDFVLHNTKLSPDGKAAFFSLLDALHTRLVEL